LEGPNVVLAAIRAGRQLETVFALRGDPVEEMVDDVVNVESEVLERLAPTQHPRGPVAVMAIPPSEPVVRSCLLLWSLADPGNVGTLIRTAAAFGMDVAVAGSGADPWAPKTLRAAAGGHFRTRIEIDASVASLKERGFTVVATVPRSGVGTDRLRDLANAAIAVGSEAHGLPADVIGQSDLLVTIPMPGKMESVNAAVAGAILAYELTRATPGAP